MKFIVMKAAVYSPRFLEIAGLACQAGHVGKHQGWSGGQEKERACLKGFTGVFMRKSREPGEVTEEGSDEMI